MSHTANRNAGSRRSSIAAAAAALRRPPLPLPLLLSLSAQPRANRAAPSWIGPEEAAEDSQRQLTGPLLPFGRMGPALVANALLAEIDLCCLGNDVLGIDALMNQSHSGQSALHRGRRWTAVTLSTEERARAPAVCNCRPVLPGNISWDDLAALQLPRADAGVTHGRSHAPYSVLPQWQPQWQPHWSGPSAP